MIGAQKLLQQYNLDMSHVMSTTTEKGNIINEDRLEFKDEWETRLLSCIADNNFCDTVWWSKLGKINIIGKPGNIAVVIYLYKFYHMTILEMSVKSYTQMCIERCNGLEPSKSIKRTYLYDYILGAISGISRKLYDNKRNVGSEMNAVMVLNDKELEEYMEVKYPKVKQCKSLSAKGISSAFNNGFNEGYNIKSYNAVTSGAKQLKS